MSRRPLFVSFTLVLNIAVFLMWTVQGPGEHTWMANNFTTSWDLVWAGRWWTLLTSIYSHNLLLHLLVNMMVLNSFGSLLEGVLGSWRFLRFYLAAGVLASLCHCMVSAWLLGAPELRAVGASGAIAGLVLLFSLMFPREKILLFGLIPVPALLGALAFIGLDLWGLMAQAEGGGLPIGHGAHLGGAFAGILYYVFVVRSKWQRRRHHYA